MPEITMPRLSDSMESGTILTWLIDDGQPVAQGEDLLEIETDKATMTHAADAEGILTVVAAAGTTVPVGAVIAHVGAPVLTIGDDGGDGAEPPPAPDGNAGGAMVTASAARAAATPLARRVAQFHGVALDDLRGTGPGGRIVRADVFAALGGSADPPPTPRATAIAAKAPAPSLRRASSEDLDVEELTRLQRTVADRMAQSTATVPHFQVQTEVTMDAAIALRAELKQQAGDDPTPSINDLIVKASALALRRHPRANGCYRDGRFELHRHINVGVAVAADDALVVPVIADTDIKSLGQIARESRRLAEAVRSGTFVAADIAGGTFTVSNLGMYGMTAIVPVINVPQAAILGVGATREQFARIDGEIRERSVLTLTLSCDHRILYGADAARFLADIRALLEAPLRLTL